MEAKKSVVDQYLTVNQNRRIIYSFLSKIYEKEVTVDFIRELTEGKRSILQIEGLQEWERGEFRGGLEMLRAYLRGLGRRDLEEVQLELAVEYANLFLGVGGGMMHPSESAYRSKDHHMMGEPLDEVRDVYWNAGVDKVKEYTEPEDHIAIELQFMAYLCRKTVETLERGEESEASKYLRMQKDFIDSHIALWVPQLAKDILEKTKVEFYKALANITDQFIESERKGIDDLIEGMRDLFPKQ